MMGHTRVMATCRIRKKSNGEPRKAKLEDKWCAVIAELATAWSADVMSLSKKIEAFNKKLQDDDYFASYIPFPSHV